MKCTFLSHIMDKVFLIVGVFFLPFTLLSVPQVSAQVPALTLTLLNVGEGDALLLETPQHHLWMIDAGNLMSAPGVEDALRKVPHTLFDGLIFTHPHPDHIGGAFGVLGRFSPVRLYDNGELLDDVARNEPLFRWYIDLVRKRPNYASLSRGTKIPLEGGALHVLWPPRPLPSQDWNTNSLVMKATFGRSSMLFMGDANAATERELVKLEGDNLRSTILKAGHHGAGDTGTTEFVHRVSPQLVLVSVNSNNIHGYPDHGTLARYAATGAQIKRTDEQGEVSVRVLFDGSFSVNK